MKDLLFILISLLLSTFLGVNANFFTPTQTNDITTNYIFEHTDNYDCGYTINGNYYEEFGISDFTDVSIAMQYGVENSFAFVFYVDSVTDFTFEMNWIEFHFNCNSEFNPSMINANSQFISEHAYNQVKNLYYTRVWIWFCYT